MSNEYAKRTVKDVLKSLALLTVVCIAGYFLLRPSASELAGGWSPPAIFSDENAFAKYDESKTTLAEDRATSFKWLSSEPVMALENGIRKISNPPFNAAAWIMSRVIDERLPKIDNFFLQGLLNMAVVFAIGIAVVFCGYSILWPRKRHWASSPNWELAFATCVVAGALFGLGLLGHVMVHIFFIPFLLFAVGTIVALVSVYNLLRDIFRKGAWALFTLAAMPVGFTVGFFIATALAIALVFIVPALIVGIIILFCPKLLHLFASPTGKTGKLSDGTVVEEYSDGTWVDGSGTMWRRSGFGRVTRVD